MGWGSGSRIRKNLIPDLKPRGQKSSGSRTPDPQHCYHAISVQFLLNAVALYQTNGVILVTSNKKLPGFIQVFCFAVHLEATCNELTRGPPLS
jgi:hypothetical protein